MKVLVACEFSGIVRDAFLERGHDAVSCDLLPSGRPGPHVEGDVLSILNFESWDIMIAHPPCTYLAVSGARWFKNKREEQNKAIDFFMALASCNIHRICIENPVCIMSTEWRKPDQYIHPWQFGHNESKKTGLWLKNLPKLKETCIVKPEYTISKSGRRYSPVEYCPQTTNKDDRRKNRSRTYQGIAEAMADQWNF